MHGSSVLLNTAGNFKFWLLGEIHTIRFSNFNRIRILFEFRKSGEYEYEYIRFWKIIRIWIRILFDTIRFENIWQIRIRIWLFGLNYSNTIRIPNYSLTSDLAAEKICTAVYAQLFLWLWLSFAEAAKVCSAYLS